MIGSDRKEIAKSVKNKHFGNLWALVLQPADSSLESIKALQPLTYSGREFF